MTVSNGECRICNLCDNPGSYEQALKQGQVAQVQCHVRCFSERFFTVWRCFGCRSLHALEPVDLDLFYAHYPLKQHSLNFHTRIAYRNRLRLLRQVGLKADSRLLDFGCGKGLFVKFLRERGHINACGFDPYSEEFGDPAVLRQQYDFVVSYDVIEHVPDPQGYFAELLQMVQPHGQLVVGTPNAEHINLHPDDKTHAVELSQPYHRHILSESALNRLAELNGMQATQRYTRFYYDSLLPTANTRFIWAYVAASGGMIDVAVEPIDWRRVLTSPRLMFEALFGYFRPTHANILMTYRRSGLRQVAAPLAYREVSNG